MSAREWGVADIEQGWEPFGIPSKVAPNAVLVEPGAHRLGWAVTAAFGVAREPGRARRSRGDRRRALVRPLQHHWPSMFFIFSNRLGCLGSIVATILGSLLLIALMRGCSAAPMSW
jgi:hypothetical protein